MATKDSSPIYQLKVTLKGIRPPIWRRLLVPADFSLGELHRALQTVMGWEDCHLHQFVVDDKSYGVPDEDDVLYGTETLNETRYKLCAVAPTEKSRFRYEYDFGDCWEHDILVEKILQPKPGMRYPVCAAGRRAGPPEDCGGVWGYAGFLEAIADPEHEDHEMYMEWVGGEFDPEEFAIAAVNQLLATERW